MVSRARDRSKRIDCALSRSSVYYLSRPVPPARLAITHRVDALHLENPFAGSRMLRDLLRAEGVVIGRPAVATLMRRMGIEALYRRPNTSKPAPGHKIYPYLLGRLVVDPGQPIHQRGLHGAAAGSGDRDQHGRAGRLAGQRLCRAAVAFGEI